MIKPEFWNDEKMGSMNESVMLTYIGTWTFSDDYGVVKGNHIWLKNQIFPYKQNLRLDVFSKWLEALESQDMLIPFTVKGEQLYFIRKFRSHQSVEKPSKTRNCKEDDLVDALNSIGFQLVGNEFERVGEQSGNSRGVLPAEEKRSISLREEKRTNVLVGQVADAMSDDSLKKNYRELVNSLSGKTSSEIWVALKEFVKKERPAFFDPYLDLWNIFAIRAGLIKEPQRSTDKRLNKFRTRIRESGFDFLKILEKIQASGFLKGSNEKGWKVSIEFILDSQENYTKILEGKYETQ